MAQYKSIHTVSNLTNQIQMSEQRELADIKHIKNEATANYMYSKLQRNENKVNYIQSQLYQEKKEIAKPIVQETNQELLDLTHQNKEKMLTQFAKFEDDL